MHHNDIRPRTSCTPARGRTQQSWLVPVPGTELPLTLELFNHPDEVVNIDPTLAGELVPDSVKVVAIMLKLALTFGHALRRTLHVHHADATNFDLLAILNRVPADDARQQQCSAP